MSKRRSRIEPHLEPGSETTVLLGPGISIVTAQIILKTIIKNGFEVVITWNPHDAGILGKPVVAVRPGSFDYQLNQDWFTGHYRTIEVHSLEGSDLDLVTILEKVLADIRMRAQAAQHVEIELSDPEPEEARDEPSETWSGEGG